MNILTITEKNYNDFFENVYKECIIKIKCKILPSSIINLTNLKILQCSHNNLTSLEGIQNLINLKKLYCFCNQLTSLDGIQNLINLTTLNFCVNNLTSLDSIQNLTNLTEIYFSHNKLISLPSAIQNLTNLTTLSCSSNQLTSLPLELLNLRRLTRFYHEDNPIENIHPLITRFLNRQTTIRQHVYSDAQSVHNHNIQESVKTSLINLFKDNKSNFDFKEIIEDDVLTIKVKEALIEYCNDKTEHSTLLFTFEELLVLVWQRIESHVNNKDIKAILNQEMADSICFTGRISRLLNTLNGFYDDIKINIGSGEQIGNIILLTKEKLEREGNYSIDLYKEIVFRELKERDYDQETIEVWLSQIE